MNVWLKLHRCSPRLFQCFYRTYICLRYASLLRYDAFYEVMFEIHLEFNTKSIPALNNIPIGVLSFHGFISAAGFYANIIIQLPFGARTSEVAPINCCSELLSSSSNLDQFVNYRSFANELQRNHMFPWISCHNLRYLSRTPGVLLVNYWWQFKFVWMKARAQWIPNCNIHFS